jgi:hypothetical protein
VSAFQTKNHEESNRDLNQESPDKQCLDVNRCKNLMFPFFSSMCNFLKQEFLSIATLIMLMIGSFLAGGAADSAVMEKMDVDDDAVVDLSVKYVYWHYSQCSQIWLFVLCSENNEKCWVARMEARNAYTFWWEWESIINVGLREAG